MANNEKENGNNNQKKFTAIQAINLWKNLKNVAKFFVFLT